MNNQYNQGAIWRKWDLHFHTPSSYDYKDKSISNQNLIDTLSDNGVSVVAVTDHHVIDVDRISDLKKLGESKNIVVLPGIEFLSDARGNEPIHFIGIFPESCDLSYIWEQIKNLTAIKDIIGKQKKENEVYCDLFDTIDLIHELGGLVSIHSGKKHGSVETITNSLAHAMAQKEDIAHRVDIYELGKETDQIGYCKHVFPAIRKVLPMVICSDNHDVKNYTFKSNCWLKCDPTFEGLSQIINEPSRVFIGEEPPLLAKVQKNRTKYIDHLSISQISGYNGIHGRWFDNIVVPFNKELVAIIGNKGSGKSAIADIVALCSNVNPTTDFSFLTNKKFREKSGLIAKNFEANLVFESTDGFSKGLNDSGEEDDQPLVKYLPQGQFETLTNEIVGAEEFRKEIEKVVFTHLKEEDRYGASNFQEVIENEKRVVEEEISHQKIRLKEINRQIIDLEQKTKPSYKTQLENSIEQKRKEVKALIKPEEVADPNNNPEIKTKNKQDLSRIKELTKEIEDLETKIRKKKEKRNSLKTEVRTLNDTQKTIELKVKEINEYKNNLRTSFNKDFAIDIDKVLSVEVDFKTINDLIASKSTEIEGLGNELGDSEDADKTQSLPLSLSAKQGELKTLQNGLGYEQRLYQEYLNALANFEKSKSEIEGNETTPDTIKYLEKELNYVANDLTSDLKNKKDARNEISKLIFDAKKKVITIYRTTKSTIDSEIEKNAELLGDYRININATLVLQARFNDEFFPKIDRQKAGTFRGKEDGAVQLKKITDEVNFDEKDQVIEFLRKIIDALNNDLRDPNNPKSSVILDQVKDPEKLYEYLFGLEFLDYNYQLRQGDKSLEQLSPGERGALLLVFYLLLDKDDKPLIIDQPEDNLDNHSVAKVLVPFIRRAKKNRQIIMVTHNPNLAVYADAEQIICVDIDKENKNKFSFKSGSIENNEINESIVKILEGTMPAFNKRKQKYHSN